MTALGNDAEYDFFSTFDNKINDWGVSWDNIYKYPDINKEPTNFSIIKDKLNSSEYFS